MKITVSQAQLSAALSSAARVASSKNTLPVLSNVLLTVTAAGLEIAATDLEIGLVQRVFSIGLDLTNGTTTVNAKLIADIVSTLTDPVDLELDKTGAKLHLRSGKAKFDLATIDPNDYPPMPPFVTEGETWGAATLLTALGRVVIAAETDDARPVLKGVKLTPSADGLQFCATDGFRIHKADTPIASQINAIVPAAALKQVAGLAKGEANLLVRSEKGRITFQGERWMFAAQLIEGMFPDWERILPKTHALSVTVDGALLTRTVRQAMIVAPDTHVIRLAIVPAAEGEGTITVSGESSEVGKAETTIPAEIDGPELLIAFNGQYLREGLEAAGGKVEIKMTKNNQPAVVENTDGNFIAVVMPMSHG